jgi:glutamyl-tRNA reductase
MEIAVIGLNHKTAPTEIREKVAFTDTKKIEVINSLLDGGIEELVLLSTCNRSEIYIAAGKAKLTEEIHKVKSCYKAFLAQEESEDYLYVKSGDEAVYHLYKVAAGLDSIVLGEDQILGQVKDVKRFLTNSSEKQFLPPKG